MSYEVLGRYPRLRRWLPWMLWGLAAVVAVPLVLRQAGIGSSPALVEARITALAPARTGHRMRIAKILVQPGERVQAGQLLVQLDTSEVEAELALARAKLTYAELIAGWRQTHLQDERTHLAHVLATTAERAAVEAAQAVTVAERDGAELAELEANLTLEQRLVGDQLASAERLRTLRREQAALARKVDEYGAVVARARHQAGRARGRLDDWRQGDGTLAEAAPGGLANGDVRAAAGEVQRRAIARLELLRTQHELRAPCDGRVGDVLAHAGELAADPATPLLTLVEESPTVAIAYVAQGKANQVQMGDLAKLVPRDLAGPALTGRVVALAPNISEIPERLRRVPTLREYGRNVYIRLDAPARLPGQAFDAVFSRGKGGGS